MISTSEMMNPQYDVPSQREQYNTARSGNSTKLGNAGIHLNTQAQGFGYHLAKGDLGTNSLVPYPRGAPSEANHTRGCTMVPGSNGPCIPCAAHEFEYGECDLDLAKPVPQPRHRGRTLVPWVLYPSSNITNIRRSARCDSCSSGRLSVND